MRCSRAWGSRIRPGAGSRHLAGGQRGRVSLGAALLGTPELLVLDEPTVGLDPVLREELWQILYALAADGVTLLVAPSLLIGLFAWLFSDQPGVFTGIGGPILAIFPFILMFLMTSVTTLRERRSGTFERLMTMPLGRGDFILGYALAFGLVAVLQAVITVTYAVVVCGLTVGGPIWQLGLVGVVDGLLGTVLGLLASAFARTEFQAVQFMPVVVFPQVILGGVLMPRDQMPDVLTAISDWLPLSYAVDAVNAVTAGHEGWELWRPILIIVGVLVIVLALAALTLRRRTP